MKIGYTIQAFGKPGLIATCLTTFRKFHPNDEMLVVDDAGPDGEEIRRIASLYNAGYVRQEVNQGWAAACNRGIKELDADIVVLVNSDIEFTRGLNAILERAFESDDQIAAVGGLLYYPDGRIQHGGGFYQWHGCGHYGHGKWPFQAKLCSIPAYRFHCTGALFAVRKSDWEKYPFDEGLRSESEDGDFCLRLWKNGKRTFYDPEFTAIHAEGATRGRNPQEKIRLGTYLDGEMATKVFLKRLMESDLEKIHLEINDLNGKLHPELPRAFIRMGAMGDAVRALRTYKDLKEKMVVITEIGELFRNEPTVAITNQMDEYAWGGAVNLDLAYERHRHLSIEQAYALIAGTPYTQTESSNFTATSLDWQQVREMERGFPWDQPYAVVHLNNGWPAKTLPFDYYVRFCDEMIREGMNIVVIGARSDIPLQGPKILNMINRTNLGQLRAIMEHAKIFFGPDGGPLHIADGACPAIGLFTITTPENVLSHEVTGFQTNAECSGCLLRKPVQCYHDCDFPRNDPRFAHCVNMFDMNDIVKKAKELIAK